MQTIMDRFETSRRELLDLSLRSPLIHFKLRKATGVEFTGNLSELYQQLYVDGKNIFFSTAEGKQSSKILIDLPEKELRERLLKTYRSYRLCIEEKGINMLFLAFGFLRWTEDEKNFYRAPLLLLPVDLKRVEGSERYYISYSNEDVRVNISLITKIKTDFGIDLEYADDEFESIDQYFHFLINKLATVKSSWSIEINRGALDFFSYAKFLMYKDLNIMEWTKDGKEVDLHIVGKLFTTGFQDRLPKINVEEVTSPKVMRNVVDADSSQATAIYYVNQGHNLVLQGPPGTGKSQTITNMIASSIANRKSILFVSEKLAALEVVKRRLENVGLGDLVLELHSHKANKKELLKSFEKTLRLGEPNVTDQEELYRKYDDTRAQLDEYQKIVHRKIRASHLSLTSIYGELLQTNKYLEERNIRLPRIAFPGVETWSFDEYQHRRDVIDEYLSLNIRFGKVEGHLFYGVLLDSCLPNEQLSIKDKLLEMDDSFHALRNVIVEIGSALGHRACNTIFESKRLLNSIQELRVLGDLEGINGNDHRFSERFSDLDACLEGGLVANDFYYQNKDYTEKAFQPNDFVTLYETYFHAGFLKRKQHFACLEEMRTYLVSPTSERKKLAKLYEFYTKYRDVIVVNEKTLEEMFQNKYQGVYRTDWVTCTLQTKKIRQFHEKINQFWVVPQARNFLKNLDKVDKLVELQQKYQVVLGDFLQAYEVFVQSASFDAHKRFGYHGWIYDITFTEMNKLLRSWIEQFDKMIEVVRFNDVLKKMHTLQLDAVVSVVKDWNHDFEYLQEMINIEYFDSLINDAYVIYPELKDIKKFRQDRLVDTFKELDIKIMVENIKEILKQHWLEMPKLNDTSKEMAIIRRELQKKRNIMPIRKFISRTSTTIQKIKPVFMMSPLSIASYLTPNEVTFDLVIFDEASQVRPVEAFGALLRAKQVVVVGDSQQLPPTSFFDSLTSKYEDMDDEDYDISSMESILSLLLAKNIEQRTLEWHYRSQHRSLIAVSNAEFYQSNLKIFPSVCEKDYQEGLILKHLPNTVYQRGGSRTNPLEAKEVIKAAFQHALDFPHLSLGIASFSLAQQEELYREFERQMKKNADPRMKDYFKEHTEEPFFIKNLENVQGDERDVIFISVGYGFDENRVLTMDFGPLNKEGGERRLNVLITRAKQRCVVFTNISSHDIQLSRTNAVGVKALKRFLEYAQTRVMHEERNYTEEIDEFTAYLYDSLRDLGYEVDRSIGQKVGIDLAVVDPTQSNRFVVGIECESEAYAKLESATDRERIRKNVLNKLGWRIYHIWTPDFYRNPKTELKKLTDFIDELNRNQAIMKRQESFSNFEVKRKEAEEYVVEDIVVNYPVYKLRGRNKDIWANLDFLQKCVTEIIALEQPIHKKMLQRRLQDISGLKRLTDKQLAMIDQALIHGELVSYADFISYRDFELKQVRCRKDLDLGSKKVEYIDDLELERAIIYVLEKGLASEETEILLECNKLFGFTRNQRLNERLLSLIHQFLLQGRLIREEEALYLNDEYRNEL